MNRTLVDRIADAVLYEGYILYPYRPSVKNRQRWTFGGLFPETWSRAHETGDSSRSQSECLVHGSPTTNFEAVVRFLHLTCRRVGAVIPPLADWPSGAEPAFRPVESLRVGDKFLQTWQEAEEREVVLEARTLEELSIRPQTWAFSFPGGRRTEPVRGTTGGIEGVLLRTQHPLAGTVEASACKLAPDLFRVTVSVLNRTPLEEAGVCSRDEALLCSFVSTHVALGVTEGVFVSLLDPPERWRAAAVGCRNLGTWPVLVGAEGQTDTMLSSPIILYDYPRIAPESPGSFFDGTEIDEMLTLRILTLTDEEKRAMAAIDDRTRSLLARTETMADEQLRALHGTLRPWHSTPEEAVHE